MNSFSSFDDLIRLLIWSLQTSQTAKLKLADSSSSAERSSEGAIDESAGSSPEPPAEPVRNADELHGLSCNALQSGFFNRCQIFTDGSMQANGNSGSCFILHNLTTEHIVYKCYRLNDQISSCVSEYAAIFQALTFLISNEVERSHIELYTDVELAPFFLSEQCDKTVLGKRRSKINLLIIKERIRTLRSRQNVLKIKWMRRNTVLLNKYADLFAKQGSHLERINFDATIILA